MGGDEVYYEEKNQVGRIVLWILAALAVITPLYIFTSGYIKSRPKLQYTFNQTRGVGAVQYPKAEFAVISDLHYYDRSLGTTGTAFEEVLHSDRKLLRDSKELLDLAVQEILKSDAKFVLIPGDLTKDGEKLCHQMLVSALSPLTYAGKKVFVVPGNHDVNNPGAVKFEGNTMQKVPSVTPEEFEEIYKNQGFGDAISRDPNSLSYVAEPVEGLWLIGLDSCRYKENTPDKLEIVGGKLSQGQEKWLEDQLILAKEKGKAVMVMEHHGLVEHWKGQGKLHPDYLIQDYKYVGELLASFDVRVAFTGHYHAQDISLGDFKENGFLYDIETGSLLTAPCAIRFCNLSDNKLSIRSKTLVESVHPGTDFAKNADNFVKDTVAREAFNTLRKYGVSEGDAKSIADNVAEAFSAHYKGDEDVSQKPKWDEGELSILSKLIYSTQKYVVEGLWEDNNINDNTVTLDLEKK